MPAEPTVEENLALDDELLARGREVFRVWQSTAPAVVLGRSCVAERDVYLDRCEAEGIPVLRRSSGGGTVWIGPGCVNYTLVLSLTERPELTAVEASYERILTAIRDWLDVPGLTIAGTDLLLDGKKVAGCAQRRTRDWLLHHGTILGPEADLASIERLLREPPRQPAHRAGRPHAAFLTRLPDMGFRPPALLAAVSADMLDEFR